MPFNTPEKKREWQRKPHVRAYMKRYSKGYRARHQGRLTQQTKEWNALRRYGITYEEAEAMIEGQGGMCALCRQRSVSLDLRKRGKWSAAIDHCHDTGKVRGVICRCCNVGLGMFGDTVEGLQRAIDYLNKERVLS